MLIELAIAKAAELNKEHPEAMVDWRELAGFEAKGRAIAPVPTTKPPPVGTGGKNGSNGAGTRADRAIGVA